MQKGSASLPDEDTFADMYELAVDTLESNGFHRYEISNFAKSISNQSVHNKWYWVGGDYVGIGPGAHSRFWPTGSDLSHQVPTKPSQAFSVHGRQARIQTLEPENWMKEVERFGHGTRKITAQSATDVLGELLATSLRTSDGLTAEVWHHKLSDFGLCSDRIPLTSLVEGSHKLGQLIEDQLVITDQHQLRLSKTGLNVADFVIPYLLNSLNKVLDL